MRWWTTVAWMWAAWLLCAGAPSPSRALDSPTLLEDGARLYPTRYYRDTADSSAAAQIVLAPGQSRSSVDIALDTSGGAITGRLQASEGSGPQPAPLTGVLIEAVVRGRRALTRSAVDGSYRLTGVPAGIAIVRYSTDDARTAERRYQAVFHPGVTDLSQAERVTVTDGEVTDLGLVKLHRSVRIGGVVRTGDTGSPMEGIEVLILSRDKGAAAEVPGDSVQMFPGDDGYWRQWTDAEGRFLQGGLPPGTYTVFARSVGGEYIPEYLGGARDLGSAQTLTFASGEEDINLELTPDRGGSVVGEIRNEGLDEPIPGIEVQATLQGSGERYVGLTGEFGAYSIVGLPTGQYLVYVPAIRKYFPDTYKPEEARLVSVTEPLSSGGTDLNGIPGGECRLPPQSQGTISGSVQADFDHVSRAFLRVWSATDTIEVPVEFPGPYAIACLRPDSYRVAFYADGPLRLQYYKKVNSLEQATWINVTTADTSDTVDFDPDDAIRIEGRVRDRATGDGLSGVRIRAVELNTGARAEAETGDDGGYVLDRLGLLGETDIRTGMPAGSWRVAAETTLVEDPILTPVLQPTIEARVGDAGRVQVEWELPLPGPWSYEVHREQAGTSILLVAGETSPNQEGRIVHADDTALEDEPVRYRLLAWPRGSTPEYGFEAFSDWLFPSPQPGTTARWSIRVAPSPWNGGGMVRFMLQRDGRTPALVELPPASRLRIVSPSGRVVLDRRLAGSDPALAWDGLDGSGRPVASGIYLLQWREEGRIISPTRADGLIVLVR